MRKCAFLLMLSLLCLTAGSTLRAQDRVEAIRKVLLNPETDQVLVVAHRAYWRSNAPENSLAAIDSAIQLKMDMVELDVWRTKDHHLVLMHDPTVDRTTDGKGRIADMTLAEIKQLRLKDKDGRLTSHRVPTLREALLLAKGKIMINLDKAYGFFAEVYPLLEETGTTRQIVMKGNAPAAKVKQDFGQYLDKVIYMPIVSMDGNDVVDAFNRGENVTFTLDGTEVTLSRDDVLTEAKYRELFGIQKHPFTGVDYIEYYKQFLS